MKILIFSTDCDLHANAVAWALNGNNISTAILNVENFPSEFNMAISPGAAADQSISIWRPESGHQSVSIADVRGVWCRRMLHSWRDLNFDAIHPDDLDNVIPVCNTFIPEVWHFLADKMPNACWLNPLASLGAASGKARQLSVARSIGFSIPDTIMGNDPDQVRAFCEKHGGTIIMKPFITSVWRGQNRRNALGTTQISSKDLVHDMPIRLCPAIFQNLIKKRFELRVLVLGEQIFAAKLDSQSNDHTSLDWRRDVHQQKMKIEPFELTPPHKEKILAFMKKLHLEMGSLDFIIDEAGELVFLEVNEQGQFLFLEARCPELNLLARVANFLAQKAGQASCCAWPTFATYLQSDHYAKVEQANQAYYAKTRQAVKYTQGKPLTA